MVNHRVKGIEICESVVQIKHIWFTFDLDLGSMEGRFDVIRCTCLFDAYLQTNFLIVLPVTVHAKFFFLGILKFQRFSTSEHFGQWKH